MTSRWWSATALAVVAGASLVLAHPPTGWWVTSVVTVPLLITALRADEARHTSLTWPRTLLRAFALGLVAGLVAYGPMIVWLVAPAGLVGWGALVLIQAAWVGVWAVMVRPWVRSAWAPVVVTGTWVGMDAWRSLVPLSGFGWGTIADAHAADAWLLPVARTLGGRGLTALVVVIGMLGLALIDGARAARAGSTSVLDAVRRPALALATVLVVAALLGRVPAPATAGVLDVLVVQANDIRHWEESVADAPLRITTTAHDLTVAAVEAEGRPDLTVWPESSIDRDPSTPRGAPLGRLALEAAAVADPLVAGASLDGPDPATQRAIVALLLGPDGETDRYVKRRLVPFGEYVPLRRWLEVIPALDQVPRDAVAGRDARSLEVATGVRAAVAICFETLFSDIVRTNVLAGPVDAGIVLAITNDASFRDGAEPAQHLAQSRLRAVETGRWVVHAALSGSSAFVDPSGGVHDATDLFTATTIRRDVPLAVGRTPYLTGGDVVGGLGRIVFVAAGVDVVLAAHRRRMRAPAPPASAIGSVTS